MAKIERKSELALLDDSVTKASGGWFRRAGYPKRII